MQVVGREDEDGVEVGIGDQRLGGAGERAGAVAARRSWSTRLGETSVDRGDLEARVVGQQRQVHELGDFAEADQADLDRASGAASGERCM